MKNIRKIIPVLMLFFAMGQSINAQLTIGAIDDATVAENTPYTGPTPTITGNVGAVTYTLGGADASLFTIDSATGVVSMVARDYENPEDERIPHNEKGNTYNVSITATDNNNTPADNSDDSTDTEDWVVSVTDVTEVANFSIAVNNATTNEGQNGFVLPPTFTGDTPIGDFLSYTYTGEDAALVGTLQSDGAVFMLPKDYENPQDHDRDNVYRVITTATDQDGNTATSAEWTLTVLDVEEQADFTLGAIEDTTIDENTAYTGPTPTLSGDDPIGTVTYTLGGADAAQFTIDSATGVVSMVSRDFENPQDQGADNIYDVTIIATDSDGNTDTEGWTVTVLNLDFGMEPMADATIDENTAYTGQVPALAGEYPIGAVTYTLGGADAALFTIDDETGVVSMVSRDFENPEDSDGDNTYNVAITATDSDNNSDTEAWTVTVRDVEEQADFTIGAIANATVDENTAYTGPVPTLSGDDPIGTVTYTLGGADAALFTIDSATGVVSKEARDFEDPRNEGGGNTYNVAITATDSDNNNDTAAWTVRVKKHVDFTINTIANATVDENTAYMGPMPTLSGDDPIGTVTYTLGGADAALFSIDGATGQVSMVARDFEEPNDDDADNIYNVSISATDGDDNTDTAAWAVTIKNVKEHANFTLHEWYDVSTERTLRRTDRTDNRGFFFMAGVNKNRVRNIGNGDEPIGGFENLKFALSGEDAGMYVIERQPTREEAMGVRIISSFLGIANAYDVTLTATDLDGNSATIDFKLNVVDAAFIFDAVVNALVDENTVCVGPTRHLDGNPVGTVTYTLGGADAALFSIDSATGVVSMAAKDYENPQDNGTDNTYNIEITATDSNNNTATVGWKATVQNVEEQADFSIDAIANATVNENTAYMGQAPTLSGDDPIGNVTYTLGGADAALFTIDSATGVVSMLARDFEDP